MDNLKDIADAIVSLLKSYGIYGIFIVIMLYWLMMPEKAEKVTAQVYRLLRKIWKGAEKRYITHDIQSHINDYVNNFLSQNIKNFKPTNVKVTWIDENQNEDSFRKGQQLVIRMRSSQNQNKNLVNASMVFISQNLLHKTKHYISEKQKRSLDLYVANKLFETQREEVVKQFVEDFLINETEDKKIAEFFDRYDIIDRAGIFFPVFIEEMGFLGEKVFANRKDSIIYQEVNGLIEFLEQHSERIVGTENSQPIFQGKYCRFGIVIVGKSIKIEKQGQKPYVKHIQALFNNKAETIYLISNEKNKDFVRSIANSNFVTDEGYIVYNDLSYGAVIHKHDGTDSNVKNHLIVLRKSKVQHYVR